MKTGLETIKKIIQDGFLDIVTDILEPSEDKLSLSAHTQSVRPRLVF